MIEAFPQGGYAMNDILAARTTPERIAAILANYGVPLVQWGQSGTKTVAHLVREIRLGESVLVPDIEAGWLTRLVQVAVVDITHTHNGVVRWLKEEKQVFSDDKTRRRNLKHSISEKIHGTETPVAAARRGIREELGVTCPATLSVGSTSIEGRRSGSYPGLASSYIIHHVAATLRPEDFNPDGYIERTDEKTTYFKWHEGASTQ